MKQKFVLPASYSASGKILPDGTSTWSINPSPARNHRAKYYDNEVTKASVHFDIEMDKGLDEVRLLIANSMREWNETFKN